MKLILHRDLKPIHKSSEQRIMNISEASFILGMSASAEPTQAQ